LPYRAMYFIHLKISGVRFARVNNANEKGAKIQLPSSNYEEYLKLCSGNGWYFSFWRIKSKHFPKLPLEVVQAVSATTGGPNSNP
jgi:hypothetical protein